MADIQTVLDLIETVLTGVAGIGAINKYDRFFTTEAEFLKFHGVGGSSGIAEINSATITRTAVGSGASAEQRQGFRRTTRKASTFEIKVIRGQHDSSASQILLNRLLDAIFLAFESETNKAAFTAQGLRYDPAEITQIGVAGYGNPPTWLVNQGIVQLTVSEVIG